MRGNAADNRRRYTQPPCDPAVDAVVKADHPETLFLRDRLHGIPDLNQWERLYRRVTKMSTKKFDLDTKAELRLRVGKEISELRASLGLTQEELACRLGRKRVALARWEIGHSMPPPRILAEIAKLSPDNSKTWWLDLAGLEKQEASPPMQNVKIVPLYKDRIAAGHGLDISGEIEDEIPLPESWFPRGSKIIALKVDGDSMSPILMPGYYVLIDVAVRGWSNARKLAGHMVAARTSDGCTVKWLRREEGTALFQLIPHNVSERHPVRTITEQNWERFEILGRVVNWIGWPKPPARSK
jgi:SOS-response transcriptional repressor LexA